MKKFLTDLNIIREKNKILESKILDVYKEKNKTVSLIRFYLPENYYAYFYSSKGNEDDERTWFLTYLENNSYCVCCATRLSADDAFCVSDKYFFYDDCYNDKFKIKLMILYCAFENIEIRCKFLHIWSKEKRRYSGKYYAKYRNENIKKADGFHTKENLDKILNLQNEECYYCAKKMSFNSTTRYTVDHIIPISLGGTNWPNNLVLTCKSCNSKKGTYSKDYYWNRLKIEKGEEWVSNQKKIVRYHYIEKNKMTKVLQSL